MALTTGGRLGPYEIESAIGAGGMGEVYKARDTRLDRTVAIKILPETLAADPQFRDRFDREARAISQLTHPHICTIYDVGDEGGTAFLIMEYVEGDVLGQWLRRTQRPSIDAVVDIALQVGHALVAAHAAGIVHRDIKPDNVIIRRDGFVKVLDFGVAKLVVPSANAADAVTMAPAHTAAGLVVGTTKYMSPEQARGLPVDARSDLFSFGVLLYEMLSGGAPFDASTAADTIVAILEREPPPLTQHRQDVPPELQRIVSKCLEKDVVRRYATARDLIVDLERFKADARLGASRGSPSIAVLSFVNMSTDPENEYFCDGIAEELINGRQKSSSFTSPPEHRHSHSKVKTPISGKSDARLM